MKTLFLICGHSGAGKTTYARKLRDEGAVVGICEADHFMRDKTGLIYKFDPKKLGYCHQQCQEGCESYMQEGYNVAVSNTTLTIKEARPYIELAKKYGYSVEIVHLDGNFENTHGVPKEKVE